MARRVSAFDNVHDDFSSESIHLGSYAWSLAHNSGLIPVEFDSYARGGRHPRGDGGSNDTGGTTSTTTTYISGDPAKLDSMEYNIEIIFQGTWGPALKNVFIVCADAISDYILGDIPDVFYQNRIIDDLSITAQLVNIDGTGGILGQAGPTAIRYTSYLPATGSMQFDSADATYYNGLGLFDDIVMHEMLHTVGFGTVWGYLGLLSGAGTTTPTFTGQQATNAYAAAYPAAYASHLSWGYGVPVENEGGSGTRDSHWDEQTFNNELMTGYINSNNDLSYVTIGSLGDLGYSVISGANYLPPSFV